MQWASTAPSVLASFMASMVEFVEALTIVLAVGVVRGWRSALLGTAASLLALAALVVLLGPTLTRIPLATVQLVVGTLLLLFGLRWLRKAILRAAGVLALHDESQAFEAEAAALRRDAPTPHRAGIDRLAFATCFKIVMLEGIEVVFIVVAIGASGRMLLPATAGALLALLVVAGLGVWLHRPLARVPENTLKFAVGVMLTAFGTFWVGEGIGIAWPGADWTLLALIAVFVAIAAMLVPLCARLRVGRHEGVDLDMNIGADAAANADANFRLEPEPKANVDAGVDADADRAAGDANASASATGTATPSAEAAAATSKRGVLAAAGTELLGLFVDDGRLAAGILVWVAAAWLVEAEAMPIAAATSAVVFSAGVAAVLAASALRRAKG